MKNSKWLLLLLCFLMCFGLVYSANAASGLTAKELLLDKLQNSDFLPKGEINKTACGTADYQIKTLSGVFLLAAEPLKNLSGAALKLDYKLDSPENKLAASYDLTFNNNTYKGSIYFDNGKMIMSTDILSLIKEFDPEFNSGKKELPQYVYISDKNLATMWDNINKGQYLDQELKDLLIFFFEAIPDKYFNTSLINQTVTFSLDQNGFEDVAAAMLQKVANERERFATLVTNHLAASGATAQDIDKIKSDILGGIEKSIKDGSYPDSPEKVKKILGGYVVLDELKIDLSLLPAGQNSITATLSFGGSSDFKGKVVFKNDFADGKDKLNGTYSLNLAASESKQKMKVDGQILGEFNQTGVDAHSKKSIKVSVKDFDGNINYLDLALDGKSEIKADKNVEVNIPVLTEANSANLEKIIKNTPTVVLDGKVLAFDVDPFVMNLKSGKRILVPLRNLAEALGSEVSWVAPDQINIQRGDTFITMYINKKTYYINDEEKQLDAPPFIMGDKRTMVPVRFVAEGLGCIVQYSEAENTVYIYSQ